MAYVYSFNAEQATVAERQEVRENEKYGIKPIESKNDSSGHLYTFSDTSNSSSFERAIESVFSKALLEMSEPPAKRIRRDDPPHNNLDDQNPSLTSIETAAANLYDIVHNSEEVLIKEIPLFQECMIPPLMRLKATADTSTFLDFTNDCKNLLQPLRNIEFSNKTVQNNIELKLQKLFTEKFLLVTEDTQIKNRIENLKQNAYFLDFQEFEKQRHILKNILNPTGRLPPGLLSSNTKETRDNLIEELRELNRSRTKVNLKCIELENGIKELETIDDDFEFNNKKKELLDFIKKPPFNKTKHYQNRFKILEEKIIHIYNSRIKSFTPSGL